VSAPILKVSQNEGAFTFKTTLRIKKKILKASIYFVESKSYNFKFITSRRVLVLLEPKHVSSCCLTCSALELEYEDPVHLHSITTHAIKYLLCDLIKIPKHLIGSPAGRTEFLQATIYGIKPFTQRFKLQTAQECKMDSHNFVSRNDVLHNLHCATLFTFKRLPLFFF